MHFIASISFGKALKLFLHCNRCNLVSRCFLKKRWCYSSLVLRLGNNMKLEDLSVFKNDSLSTKEKEKLKIVIAFYDRLPTEEMKREFLELVERQPLMAPGEFDACLDDFVARVKTAGAVAQVGAYIAVAASTRVH
jgi:hypothetical protein